MDSEEFASEYDEGLELIEKQEYSKALDIFNRLILEDLSNLDYYYQRGIILSRLNMPLEAARDFSRVIERDPDLVGAFLERARIYGQQGNFHSAIDDLDIFIEKYPEFVDAYYERAMANLALGRIGKAAGDLSVYMEVYNEDVNLYMLRGRLYMALNVIDRAILDFTCALELQSDLAEAYSQRANAIEISGDPITALNDYILAVTCDPNSVPLRLALGLAYKRRFQDDKAIANLKMVLEQDPGGSSAWQAIPALAQMISPDELLFSTINLAIFSNTEIIEYATGLDNVLINLMVSGIAMPLAMFSASLMPQFITKIRSICNVEDEADWGGFPYAFKEKNYVVEMSVQHETAGAKLTLTIKEVGAS